MQSMPPAVTEDPSVILTSLQTHLHSACSDEKPLQNMDDISKLLRVVERFWKTASITSLAINGGEYLIQKGRGGFNLIKSQGGEGILRVSLNQRSIRNCLGQIPESTTITDIKIKPFDDTNEP
jgi:hypothetical protein